MFLCFAVFHTVSFEKRIFGRFSEVRFGHLVCGDWVARAVARERGESRKGVAGRQIGFVLVRHGGSPLRFDPPEADFASLNIWVLGRAVGVEIGFVSYNRALG